METRQISPGLSVCAQITAVDVPVLKQRGFRSVICNRPDGEEPGQPPYAEIAAAAENAGLRVRFLPVRSGGVEPRDAAEFGRALDELPGPVLAYCRSGARSAALWAGWQALGGARGTMSAEARE